MNLNKMVFASILFALLLVSSILIAVPVHATTPPNQASVQSAIDNGKAYIYSLMNYVDEYGYISYAFVSEYPALTPWATLDTSIGTFYWVPALELVYPCGSSEQGFTTKVLISLLGEEHYNDHSTWTYKIIFRITEWYQGYPIYDYDIATIELVEKQYDSYYTISVVTLSYTSAIPWCNSDVIFQGSLVRIRVSDTYFGYAYQFYGNAKTQTFYTPQPSLRTSMRHVDVLTDIYLQAIGQTNQPLKRAVDDMFSAVFGYARSPYDLYANALYQYTDAYFAIHPVDSDAFYDAKWFGNELGYDRLYDWFRQNGYLDGSSPFVAHPIYPYKSRIVAAAELAGVDGGELFLDALKHAGDVLCPRNPDEDPMYNAWLGLYYVAVGDYDKALSEWYDVVDDWDGIGVKACYSEHYSTVRLALAVMLGTHLAQRGMLDWSTVDSMVEVLLQLQWSGSGWYKPEDGNWVYIHKYDHKNGFLVSYDVGPDGSYGFTPFRPGWVNYLTGANDMDPEYVGPLPTNAEATVTSIVALQLYLDSRY